MAHTLVSMRKYSKFRGGFINTPAKVFTYNKGFTALARSGMNSTPKSGVRRKFLQTAAVKLAGKVDIEVACKQLSTLNLLFHHLRY